MIVGTIAAIILSRTCPSPYDENHSTDIKWMITLIWLIFVLSSFIDLYFLGLK